MESWKLQRVSGISVCATVVTIKCQNIYTRCVCSRIWVNCKRIEVSFDARGFSKVMGDELWKAKE